MQLGNDIVDLNVAKIQSNWKRKGYLAKIFTAEEQALILDSYHPDQTVWTLWSMKEAVYKIIHRGNSQRFYDPRAFACVMDGEKSLVNFKQHTYFTESVIKEDLIHTTAATERENLALIKTYYTQNRSTYLEEFNAKASSYFIEKDSNGIPWLVGKTNGKNDAISISHHGAYLAIVSHLFP